MFPQDNACRITIKHKDRLLEAYANYVCTNEFHKLRSLVTACKTHNIHDRSRKQMLESFNHCFKLAKENKHKTNILLPNVKVTLFIMISFYHWVGYGAYKPIMKNIDIFSSLFLATSQGSLA